MSTDIRAASQKRAGIATLAILLVLPLLTVWNLFVESYAPKLRVMIGPRLRGVVIEQAPVKFGLHTFADGRWQKYATNEVAEAFPLRPLLIRINNQIRLKLFGAYAAPGVIIGENGQLIEQSYLTEYCSRNLAVLEQKAREWIPKLKELQDFYEKRGHLFIYLITPSKVAYMPENFVHRVPCTAPERDRLEKLPVYDRMLAAAGVHVVDSASLTYEAKGKYKVSLFPEGGVHWNGIGVANAANAILQEINRLEKRDIAPKIAWSYEVTRKVKGEDRDLADLVNVLRPKVNYETAKVTYQPLRCEDFPVSHQKIAVIGGSFISTLSKTLAGNGCLSKLEGYNYLYHGMRAGPKYKSVKRRLTAQDIVPLRDADIVILEENESLAPGAPHAREFYRVILGK